MFKFVKPAELSCQNLRFDHAVMCFDGFLGISKRYYPIPWPLLTYNEQMGGCVMDIPEAQLKTSSKRCWDDGERWQPVDIYSLYRMWPL